MDKKKRVSRQFKFTVKKIAKLPPNYPEAKATDQEYTDTIVPGLKVFCSKRAEVKSYHLRYTFSGRKRVIKIANFECLPLSEVRDIARKYRGMISKGLDPLEERHKAKGVPTLKLFSLVYLDWARLNKRSWNSDRLLLENSIIPALGGVQLSNLTRQDVDSYLMHKRKTVSSSTVNKHRALLSKLINYSIELEVFDGENVCRKVKKLKEDPPQAKFLNHQQIRDLLAVLDQYPSNRSALLVRLLLFTGLRRGEVLKMEFKHLAEPGQIYIPGANAKGKRSRYVQINSLAEDILKELKMLKIKGNPYVFPSVMKIGNHLVNPSKFWRKIRKDAGLPSVRMHDLRHSFSHAYLTAKSNDGSSASLYSLQKMLGHANHKTTEIYAHLADSGLKNDVENVAKEINRAMGG